MAIKSDKDYLASLATAREATKKKEMPKKQKTKKEEVSLDVETEVKPLQSYGTYKWVKDIDTMAKDYNAISSAIVKELYDTKSSEDKPVYKPIDTQYIENELRNQYIEASKEAMKDYVITDAGQFHPIQFIDEDEPQNDVITMPDYIETKPKPKYSADRVEELVKRAKAYTEGSKKAPSLPGKGSYNFKFGTIDDLPLYKGEENQLEDMIKKYKYRCLVDKLGNCHNLRIEGDFTLTDEELLDYALNVGHDKIRTVPFLPQLNQKKATVAKEKQIKVKSSGIAVDTFIEKTNHLFDKPVSYDLYKNLIELNSSFDSLLRSIDGDKCLKNVFLTDALTGAYAVTTGNYDRDNNSFEVISLTIDKTVPNRYTNKTNFVIKKMPADNCRINTSSQTKSFLFRFVVKTTKESTTRFGVPKKYKSLEGKTFGYETTRVSYGVDQDKDGKYLDAFTINSRADSMNLHVLSNEIEIFALNSKYLKKVTNKIAKKIELNKSAIIFDDRRLSTFKKGDIVKVINIKADKSNYKNSITTVVDKKGNKERLLFKQIKPYVDSNQEKIINPFSEEGSSKTTSPSKSRGKAISYADNF